MSSNASFRLRAASGARHCHPRRCLRAGRRPRLRPRPQPAPLPAGSVELRRKFTQLLLPNQVDSLVARMDSATRAQPNIRGEYEQRVAMVAERGGNELKVIEEKFITRNGARQYWRTAMFDKAPEPVLIRWVIGPKGELMGVG